MMNNTIGARKRATDFPQALLDLFDHYVHGEISRRQFMDEATKFAVGGLTALDLGAAVAFYGRQPPAADAAKIKAPLLLHYASLDTRITGGWPAYEEALKANHVTYAA
jgi:Dienelactone hydrolase family